MGNNANREPALSSIGDQVAAYAAPLAERALVPAIAIGLITKDGLAEVRTLGKNHAGEPLTSQTLFEIGSATKAFLGVTEAILVDRGDLSWNDRVVDHYPGFQMHDPWVTEEFRIVDLLAQRSGLAGYAAELPSEFGYPWQTGIAGLKFLEPTSSFRSEFAYQNMPHYIAGEIVAEKIGAQSWGEAVRRLLFDPLRMTASGTAADALASSRDSTRGHTVRDGALQERPLEQFPSIAEGAGAIVSNLDDMSKWIAMHLALGAGPTGEIVTPARLFETYAPRIAVDGEFATRLQHGNARPEIGYATGWFVHALPEGRVIEHGGNTEGYNAATGFDPDRGVGVVVLTNQGNDGGIGTHLGMRAMDLIQGRQAIDYYERAVEQQKAAEQQAPARTRTGVEHPPEWYQGEFEHPLLGRVTIRPDGEKLAVTLGPARLDATATRRAASAFDLTWYQQGNPELEKHEAVIAFDEDAERPRHFTIKGFTFTHAS